MEFILKCISNNSLFWYFRDIYFVSIAKGRFFNFIYLYWHFFFQFVLPHLVPTQILAMHAVEWRDSLWLCQYNIADVTTADRSFLGPLLLLHLRLNPFLNFTNVFWSESIKDTYIQYSISAVYMSLLYFTVQSYLVNVML